MRDLSTQEIGSVYGAGHSPMPPSKKCKVKKGKGSGSRKGKKSCSRKSRCGKGGSS